MLFVYSCIKVRKLTYLQMIGYNISWAAFSIVEVMSQTRFAHKRIGYLAANQVRLYYTLNCYQSYIYFSHSHLQKRLMLYY